MHRFKCYYGWWVLSALFFITAYVSGIISFGFTSVFKPIADEFGWSYASVSIAASIRGLEIGLLAPIVGIMLDRVGPRKLIIIGALITGSGLTILSRIDSLAAFYGAFALIAIGNSTCIGVVPVTVVGNWFQKNVSLATGIVLSGTAAGGLLVPVVTIFVDTFGWRTAMITFGVGTWLILISLGAFVRHSPERYGLLPDGVVPKFNGAADGAGPIKPSRAFETAFSVGQALRTRAFWHFQITFTCHVFAIHAVLTHVMPYLSSIGIPRFTSGIAAGAIPVMSVVGRLGFGWFGDRLDKRRVTAAGVGLTAASLFGFALLNESAGWFLLPVLVMFSIGYGGPVPMIPALLREYFGRRRLGSIVGVSQGLAMIGSISGQPLAGFFFDTYGHYQAAWILFAAANVIGMLSVLSAPNITVLPHEGSHAHTP
ncbi:MAG: MFS transporter [Deltaproteobacteria bacterium]|jgi:MFS family permease|nr:MFS transporter [Deltaproteobacteria bacterium]